jgi:DNA-binding transcriptional LysR family regulator
LLLESTVMELRQLEYFVAVAEEASFTRAAARVHVAQPGVSAQVRRLERELGQELLDRSGRTVRLTGAGAAVLPYARAALAAVAGARLAVDELAGLVRGRVAVGMVTGPSLDLPDALADFHQRHPGVEITLAEDNSDRLLAALQAGQLDLALVGLSTPPPAGIRTQVVADEALVAAVSHDHPMAGRSTIPLRAMRELSLISLPRGTGMRSAVDSACAAAGFRPRIAFEASDPNVLARLAARGLGVAVLPRTLAAAHAGQLHPIAIVRPALRSRVELAWRADGPASPAARALIRHARAKLSGRPATIDA